MRDEIANCPICGCVPNLDILGYEDIPSISHCGATFESVELWNRYAEAMKAQAELDALKAAVKPVVDWYVRSKHEFPDDFTSKTVVLQYEGWDEFENVTGEQLDALVKLVGEV